MASLMRAIENDTEPETSGRDNLRTLQIVFAEYRSMAEKRAVRPEDLRRLTQNDPIPDMGSRKRPTNQIPLGRQRCVPRFQARADRRFSRPDQS